MIEDFEYVNWILIYILTYSNSWLTQVNAEHVIQGVAMFFVRIIIIVGIWFQVTFSKTLINQIHSICSSVKTYFGYCSPNNNDSELRLAFKKMADSSFSCSRRFNTLRRRSRLSHIAFWEQSVKYKHIFWSNTFLLLEVSGPKFQTSKL